jgi:hypothetical protein
MRNPTINDIRRWETPYRRANRRAQKRPEGVTPGRSRQFGSA